MTHIAAALGVTFWLLVAALVQAQSSPQTAADLPEAYRQHVERARAAAVGPARNVLNQCNVPAPPASGPGRGPSSAAIAATQTPVPGKAFDNLYFVGLPGVSSWAIDTSDGIILIDALNNARDAERAIVAGLRTLGLDPARIRYLIVTHAHGDHYGGSRYLVDRFRPRVISSEADWRGMAGPLQFTNPLWDAPPTRDMTIVDGQALTLGDTTISLYVTPGHTPGAVSVILPVKDSGASHTAALWGGLGFNFTPTPAAFRIYGDSADRFRAIVRTRGADVFLANHGFVDGTAANLSALRNRRPGDPNPYVIGPQQVQNVFTVLSECARAREVVAAAR